MDRLYVVDGDDPFNNLDADELDGFHVVDFNSYLPPRRGYRVERNLVTGLWEYISKEGDGETPDTS